MIDDKKSKTRILHKKTPPRTRSKGSALGCVLMKSNGRVLDPSDVNDQGVHQPLATILLKVHVCNSGLESLECGLVVIITLHESSW